MRPARKGPPDRLERQALLAWARRIKRRILDDGLDPELAIRNAYLGLVQLQMDLLLADEDRPVWELSRVRKRLLGDPVGTAPPQGFGPHRLRGANAYNFEDLAEAAGAYGRWLVDRLWRIGRKAGGLFIARRVLWRARGAYKAALERDFEDGWRSAGRLAWCLAGLGVPELVAKSILEQFAEEARPIDGPTRRSTTSRAWATAQRKQVCAVLAPMPSTAEWEDLPTRQCLSGVSPKTERPSRADCSVRTYLRVNVCRAFRQKQSGLAGLTAVLWLD